MKVFVATEYRIILSNGRYYVYNKLRDIIERYFLSFGKLTICSRVIESSADDKMFDISEYISSVIKIDLVETLLYLNYKRLVLSIKGHDLVIGRFDSIVSCRAASIAKQLGIPFMSEVMADAWDGYWNHGILGKLIAPYMYFVTRKAIYNSDYAVYVTEHFLQKRYPCKNRSINASNVSIKQSDSQILTERLKMIDSNHTPLILATTAAIDVIAKGHEYVIKAIPKLNKLGIQVQYLLIGGGDKTRLSKLAYRLGVENQVIFLGEKSLKDILAILKTVHIYVQPSLQEGLPRSVIEAMSQACPVIGANTAGIPELIDSKCIVKRRSSDAIARAVVELVSSKYYMKEMAILNFEKSKEYSQDILTARRNQYFTEIVKKINNEKV